MDVPIAELSATPGLGGLPVGSDSAGGAAQVWPDGSRGLDRLASCLRQRPCWGQEAGLGDTSTLSLEDS